MSVNQRSTLIVIRRGPLAAQLIGELDFPSGIFLRASEHLLFLEQPGLIEQFGGSGSQISGDKITE